MLCRKKFWLGKCAFCRLFHSEREQRISSKAWTLSVVPHFSLSQPRLAFLAWVDFHARSRFARSTIPEEKWGLLVLLGTGGLKLLLQDTLQHSSNFVKRFVYLAGIYHWLCMNVPSQTEILLIWPKIPVILDLIEFEIFEWRLVKIALPGF